MLGRTGRGLTEYCGVPVLFFKLSFSLLFPPIQNLFVIDDEMVLQVEKVDIITAAMGHALATEGGFCTGNARVIDHQVW